MKRWLMEEITSSRRQRAASPCALRAGDGHLLPVADPAAGDHPGGVQPGLRPTYSRLPVLVVRNYTDLTPQLLRRAYPCFKENAHKFNYRALTPLYWLDLVDEAVALKHRPCLAAPAQERVLRPRLNE